jgi:peptidoglycan/LPS O-acetylase OafA/YrhL
MSSNDAPVARSRLAALGGVRAIAAYAVIATHAGFQSGLTATGNPIAPLLARSNFGVTLFFLLSGFLLSRQFLIDDDMLTARRITNFWRRRLLRILPAYWLAAIGTLWLLSDQHASGKDWLSYLLLVQTYNHHYVIHSFDQSWTLAVEISFYALLPLLIWLSRQLPLRPREQTTTLVFVMYAVAIGSSVYYLRPQFLYGLQRLWLPPYLDWFALGILLASLSVESQTSRWRRVVADWARSPGTCWIVAILLFWITLLPIAGPRDLTADSSWQWIIGHQLSGAAAFFFLLPLTQGGTPTTDKLLANPFMLWLGEISYGVYLWHLGLLQTFSRWFGWSAFGGHFVAMYLLTAFTATGVAAASWYFLERPLLRRFSSSWHSDRRPKARQQNETDREQTKKLHAGATGQGIR